MKKVVTCSQMKALDGHTIYDLGIPALVLMERAALSVVEELEKQMDKTERVLVVCGSGNNGGDGIAVARLLYLKGISVRIFLTGSEERMSQDAAIQWKIACNYRVPVVNNPDWDEYTTIVDAIFGVGLSRPVDGPLKEIIRSMNASCAKKVAVDIPSGVDGDTGQELGIAFRADMTVTFAFLKRGLCFYPGRMYAGKTVVADIGIYGAEHTISGAAQHFEQEDLELLPERVPYGNKGTFGKVLLIAGSKGMCGAAFLSAAAALKAGAGMVKIQTVEENRMPLQMLLPEAMIDTGFDEENNQKLLEWSDVLIIGPGLGISPESRERTRWFLENGSKAGKTVILDADGLNQLAAHPQWKSFLNENVIITPHVGEMSRLCGQKVQEIKEDMAKTAQAYAKETGTICVLKDASTVIANAKGDLYLNLSGNAGMATAGSGDALTGILGAVFCMHLSTLGVMENIKIAALGVYLHGVCGDEAAKTEGIRGMCAQDIIRALPGVLKRN